MFPRQDDMLWQPFVATFLLFLEHFVSTVPATSEKLLVMVLPTRIATTITPEERGKTGKIYIGSHGMATTDLNPLSSYKLLSSGMGPTHKPLSSIKIIVPIPFEVRQCGTTPDGHLGIYHLTLAKVNAGKLGVPRIVPCASSWFVSQPAAFLLAHGERHLPFSLRLIFVPITVKYTFGL